jgi:hypothetical protein
MIKHFNKLVLFWLIAIILIMALRLVTNLISYSLLEIPNKADRSSIPRKRNYKPEKIDVKERDQIRPQCNAVQKQLKTGGWFGQTYSINYTLCVEDYEFDKNHRQSLSMGFGRFKYESLFTEKTKSSLAVIRNQYSKLKKEKKLNDVELAKVIVGSIQHIPYTLVHPGSHMSLKGGFIEAYHQELSIRMPDGNWEKIGGCVEQVEPFGVLGPLEVAYHHMADCDSRTLFLFSLLKSLGYDVVMLNSDVERHSILGINLKNLRGGFGAAEFEDKSTGKTYTVWETTTELPPGIYPNFIPENWFVATY